MRSGVAARGLFLILSRVAHVLEMLVRFRAI